MGNLLNCGPLSGGRGGHRFHRLLKVTQWLGLCELGAMTGHLFLLDTAAKSLEKATLVQGLVVMGSLSTIVKIALALLVSQSSQRLLLSTSIADPERQSAFTTFDQAYPGILSCCVSCALLYGAALMLLAEQPERLGPGAWVLGLLSPPVGAVFVNFTLLPQLIDGAEELQMEIQVRARQEAAVNPSLMGRSLMLHPEFELFTFGETEVHNASGQRRRRFEPLCTICFATFKKDEEIAQLPCHHAFHWACIDRWLVRNSQCPMRCQSDSPPPLPV